jgi:nucleotide-binding universal stress UspA family protein
VIPREHMTMTNFNKIMVGLDLTHMDDTLISNLKPMASIFEIKKVYFIHVSKNLILPEEISQSYPDLLAPVDETIKNEITHEIEKVGLHEAFSYEIIVKEGNPQETILRWCKIKDIDLLVMGRKKMIKGSGSLVKNLTQKYANPVFLLPEESSLSGLKKILLPIDFSFYSVKTIQLAKQISEKTDAEISCCHLYEVPRGYTKTGKSFEEFSTIMLENAKKDYEKFKKENKLTHINCTFILKQKKDEVENILAYSLEHKIDLLIIGSRGRTQSAAILLGSVAEKMVDINNEIPMLVLKKKGESMGFLEALFKL